MCEVNGGSVERSGGAWSVEHWSIPGGWEKIFSRQESSAAAGAEDGGVLPHSGCGDVRDRDVRERRIPAVERSTSKC